MSIIDFQEKIKSNWVNSVKPQIQIFRDNFDIKNDLFVTLIIILVALAGFGLGKLSALEKGREPISIKSLDIGNNQAGAQTTSSSVIADKAGISTSSAEVKGLVVAAKTGTKYYYPWCTGVSRISEKNKVWFETIEAAKQAGFSPASNCAGLK